MRVALIGGTGFVGSYLVDALIDAGHEPSLLVRPGSEDKVSQPARCRLTTGDISNDRALADTLEGSDAVIYNIGILKQNHRQGITFEALQYNGVVYAAKMAERHGISRFLMMSANGALLAGTPYQDTKYRAEKYLRKSGLDVTIFQPSVIFGDPHGKMEIATQLFDDMVAPPIPAVGFFTGWLPGRGQVKMSPVHVEDVAAAFVKTLEDPATYGQTYTLGGPEDLSWNEMIRRIASTTHRSKWILPMPIAIMKLGAFFLDWLPFFPVTRDQLTMLAEGNTAAPSDLEGLINRRPRAFTPENLAYLNR